MTLKVKKIPARPVRETISAAYFKDGVYGCDVESLATRELEEIKRQIGLILENRREPEKDEA